MHRADGRMFSRRKSQDWSTFLPLTNQRTKVEGLALEVREPDHFAARAILLRATGALPTFRPQLLSPAPAEPWKDLGQLSTGAESSTQPGASEPDDSAGDGTLRPAPALAVSVSPSTHGSERPSCKKARLGME